ncbi:MAG: hypothetical protein Q7J65_02200 [Candidatus Marinimicrobia bacterium]|nr:hypothetical protein [Candidatus Neomarinimicrobiota bacterium]
MIKTGKIVLLDSATSSFVRDDINILSKNDRIKIIDTGVFVKKLGETLKILLQSVIESICATVILTWFADYYSVLPALISGLSGKYFIVITGGYGVAYLPGLHKEAWLYCQPSKKKTFDKPLLEGMIFWCMPIIGSKTAVPEIAGSEGYEIPLDGWNHLDLDEVS